jgi:hypothetical protein
MNWRSVERTSLGAGVLLLFGCAAVGFRWIASPYLRGYAATAGGFIALSRLAAALAQREEGRVAATPPRP